jgi:cardiolipin synthase A/B
LAVAATFSMPDALFILTTRSSRPLIGGLHVAHHFLPLGHHGVVLGRHAGARSKRLLEAGVTVSRTGDDLERYHDKLLIIDRRVLYVLSFNFTHLDIDHSRGFGVVTRVRSLSALRSFSASCTSLFFRATRPIMTPSSFSPVNARKQLLALINRAKKELLIYDPKIADTEMLRALSERAKQGVDVRIIGTIGRHSAHLKVPAAQRLPPAHTHDRVRSA